MPCPLTESVNLPKPFLVKVGLLFAMVVWHLLFMGDEVPCTWLPVIAYQGLCATSSKTLLIPTVGPKVLIRTFALLEMAKYIAI